MGRSGPGSDPAPDMSERDLAELVAQVWERAGYPTAVEYHDGKTFVVAGSTPESADLVWVVPANENQQLAASWIGVYEATLENLQVGRPYLVTTGGASDEAERAADRSDVVLVDRDNLETLLRQSGIGTDRLETPTSKASPSPPPDEEPVTDDGRIVAGGTAGNESAKATVGTEDAAMQTGTGVESESSSVGGGAASAEGESGAEDFGDHEGGDGGGGGDDGGVAMTFGDDGEANDLTDDGGGSDDGDDDGVAMVFDDEGVTDLSDDAGGAGGGVDTGSGGGSDLDSIMDDEEPPVTEADDTSRRRFVKVGLGVIGLSLLGIADRLWLHLVLGGGDGGLPSYNETRVKQEATTLATGNLVQNAQSLTAGDDPFPVKYEGVVMDSERTNGYQRLTVQVRSGDRNVIARWDGKPLAVGDQIRLWGVFVDTEETETEDETTKRPLVDVVSVSVFGGPSVSAGQTTTGE